MAVAVAEAGVLAGYHGYAGLGHAGLGYGVAPVAVAAPHAAVAVAAPHAAVDYHVSILELSAQLYPQSRNKN